MSKSRDSLEKNEISEFKNVLKIMGNHFSISPKVIHSLAIKEVVESYIRPRRERKHGTFTNGSVYMIFFFQRMKNYS